MKKVSSIRGGVLVMLVLFTVSHAEVRYVGSGGYPTIQAGLDACSDGDIVIVAATTYYENLIWPDVQGIQLLSEGGPIYVKIDGNTAASVIQITTGVDSTTVINGFQIRNGRADNGGAIYCVNSSPTISNNAMQYNASIDSSGGGGAIYCFNSSPVITGNHLAQNDAAGSGGAIYCENNSSPTISDNTLYSNTAFHGAAICLDESSPLIVGNSFNRNVADSVGGGIYGRNNSSPTITENVMFANRCEAFELSTGGAITMDLNCEPTITKNSICENRGTQVGGIFCYDGIIADNTITDNAADYAGGIGIGLLGSVTITSNTITNNTADYAGGGIICGAYATSMIRDNIITDNWGEFAGGGIVCDTSSTPTIRRNVITNNGTRTGFLAQHGGGIRCSDGAAPIIDSCIIADSDGEGIYCTDGAVPSIHHNEIENNSEEGVENDDAGVTVDAENNWWGDPSGPGGAGPGSGDEVSSNVDYDPWLAISMSDSVAPATPYVLNAKVGNDAELVWNMITTDTLGNAESVDYYVIYRSSSPSFVPGSSDSIGAVFQPETTYTDVNALVAGSDYYYLIKAVDWKKNVSKKSNMAYVFRKTVNENPAKTDRNWVAMPYNAVYSTVSDFTTEYAPAGDPLEKITRLDDTLQQYESYLWLGSMWVGSDFAIEPGRAYEMVTIADTFLVFVGSNDPDGLINLNENPATTDRNWVAMPYNAVYSTVSDITTEYAPAGTPLEKITRLDDTLQQYESYLWLGSMWVGPDFAIEPGRGYEMVAVTDTTWNPTEYSNEAKAVFVPQRETQNAGITVYVGSVVEADRKPAWGVVDSENTNVRKSNANMRGLNTDVREEEEGLAANASRQTQRGASSNERSASSVERETLDVERRAVSHVVFAHVALDGSDNLIFTAYRPENPHDVLTEQQIGCGIVYEDDLGYVWFDVGNFDTPWQPGEDLIVIIEAVNQGRGYYAVVDCALDASVDIQELGMVELVPIHEAQDNVLGYSLYRNGERVNDEILTQFAADEDVIVRPVIRGGYETVYGSAGVQSDRRETPVSYAFGITPNPFSQQANITYALPEPVVLDLVVYDVTGRQVVRLASGHRDPGYYSTFWHGTDMHDRQVAAGVYFVKCTAGDFRAQEKLLLVK